MHRFRVTVMVLGLVSNIERVMPLHFFTFRVNSAAYVTKTRATVWRHNFCTNDMSNVLARHV